jgi:hypothetical protein
MFLALVRLMGVRGWKKRVMVMIEEAAEGLPIVTTSVGVTTDFCEDGHSVLFERLGNIHQFRDSVSRLQTDSGLRSCLGVAAREVWDKIVASGHFQIA